jgi:hypothetical protein
VKKQGEKCVCFRQTDRLTDRSIDRHRRDRVAMLLSSLTGGQLMQQQRFKAFQVRMCDGCNRTGGMRTWQGRVGWRFKEADHHGECWVVNGGGGGGGGGTFSESNEDRKQSDGISTTNLSSSK